MRLAGRLRVTNRQYLLNFQFVFCNWFSCSLCSVTEREQTYGERKQESVTAVWTHSTKTVQFESKCCYFSFIRHLFVNKWQQTNRVFYSGVTVAFHRPNKSRTNTFIAMRPWDTFIVRHNKKVSIKHYKGRKCYQMDPKMHILVQTCLVREHFNSEAVCV